jgi:hypothetical protein
MNCLASAANPKDYFLDYQYHTTVVKKNNFVQIALGNEVQKLTHDQALAPIDIFCLKIGVDITLLSKKQKEAITSLLPVFKQCPNLVFSLEEDVPHEYDFLAILDMPKATSYIVVNSEGNIMLSYIDVDNPDNDYRWWIEEGEEKLKLITELFSRIKVTNV